jgi:formate-dependent nitrite reductase membrane component NrfD
MTKAVPVSEVLFGRIEGAYLTVLMWLIGLMITVLLRVAVVRKDTAGMDRLVGESG